MTVLKLVFYPDKRLKEVAEPVETITEDVLTSIRDMIDTVKVYRAHGLAAPQVGINKRIFILNTDDKPQVFINPKILDKSAEMIKMKEGCLSFPGVEEIIDRHAEIRITGLDEQCEERIFDLDELDSVAAQHEMDHLDGILFIDHVSQLKRRYMLKQLEKNKKKYKLE